MARPTNGQSPPGIMSILLGLALMTPAIVVLISGIRAWSSAAKYKAPIVMPYAQFVRNPPDDGWYTIPDAMVDVRQSVSWVEQQVPIDVFAPLLPLDGGKRDNASVFVEIDDSPTLSALLDQSYAKRKGGDTAAMQFESEHMAQFVQRRPVSVLVSRGRRDPIGEWSKFGLDAATLTYIADGWKPNLVLAYCGTFGGVTMVLFSLALIDHGRKKRTASIA